MNPYGMVNRGFNAQPGQTRPEIPGDAENSDQEG